MAVALVRVDGLPQGKRYSGEGGEDEAAATDDELERQSPADGPGLWNGRARSPNSNEAGGGDNVVDFPHDRGKRTLH